MKKIITENSVFIYPLVVVWLFLAYILLAFTKGQIHLFINQYYSGFFDVFFKLYTNVGNGLVPVVLVIIFLFVSLRKALIIGVATALAGIVAQIFKRFIFYDQPRPKLFFQDIADLHMVPGVELYTHHSFPSGHTATAFSMFFVLAFYTKSKLLKVICLISAALVAYSRMYLSQHFLCDVYFGSLFGFFSGIVTVWFFEGIKNDKIDLPLFKK